MTIIKRECRSLAAAQVGCIKGEAMNENFLEMVSTPDTILDGICDIARDSLRAEQAYIFLFCGADVKVVAESRVKEKSILRRFPRALLNKGATFKASFASNRFQPPQHIFLGSRDFTSLISDNESLGAIMVGFDQLDRKLTAVEKEIMRRLSKTAVSHILREVLLGLSARKFLDAVDQTKL